jgi:hypothetical protein
VSLPGGIGQEKRLRSWIFRRTGDINWLFPVDYLATLTVDIADRIQKWNAKE